jgi:outer membrane receptor protein involved in Fe transport
VDANGQPVNAATYGQAGTFHGGLDEHNVSWSAGLDYKLTPDVLLYANASRGYKAGGFAQVAAAVWTQFAPIKQESVMAYEGGIKTELLDRSVTLNAAGFYYDYSDKQVRGKFVDPIFGLLDALVSVPKSKIYGAEFDTAFRPMRSLTIGAAATYLNSSVEQYNGVVNFAIVDGLHVPVTASFAGARLPFAPTWQGILTAEYEQPLSARLTGFVGANLTAQTSSYAILAITDADKSNYAVPSRALTGVNLGVESADHQWKTMIWGKNIFDRYYTINTLLPVDTLVRYAGRPAEWGLTVSGRF